MGLLVRQLDGMVGAKWSTGKKAIAEVSRDASIRGKNTSHILRVIHKMLFVVFKEAAMISRHVRRLRVGLRDLLGAEEGPASDK